MDEPTNHLDIASKNVLKKALLQFEGTLILVSHDRDFLQDLCEKVYSFKDGEIREYLGDINYFLEQHDLDNMREVEKRTRIKEVNSKVSKGKKNFNNSKQRKKLQNRLSKIESEISNLENQIINDDSKISEDFEKYTSDENFFKNYQDKKDKVEELMEEWEKMQSALDD